MQHSARLLAGLSLAVVAAAALAGCASGDEAPSAGAGPTEETTTAPEETAAPDGAPDDGEDVETAPEEEQEAAFEMPKACAEAYGTDLFEALSGSDGFGPLNDPGMTLLSTQVVGALELLDRTDSMRCSWGVPSEIGVATTIAEIDDDMAQELRAALDAEGAFECDDAVPTTCAYAQTIDGDASQASSTETHVFGAGGWVASTELNTGLEPGYSESIRDTLWG